MIWGILQTKRTYDLPARCNMETLLPLISGTVEENTSPRMTKLSFNCKAVQDADPIAIVILSNLIEFLRKQGTDAKVINTGTLCKASAYLRASGLVEKYADHQETRGANNLIDNILPLETVRNEQRYNYLLNKLIPWIGRCVDIEPKLLDALRVSLEEVFLNIDHHSQVGVGCVMAEYLPSKREILIAISDFGVGIPVNVRKKEANLADKDALEKACEEGFTTKSNVRNRGAGLPLLLRYVTGTNNGFVRIISGKGMISASPSGNQYNNKPKLSKRSSPWHYPGTLVSVKLDTENFASIVQDVEQEDFSW